MDKGVAASPVDALESLNGQAVGPYRLRVAIDSRTRYADQRDFSVYVTDASGHPSAAPVFRGRYNAGRPSAHVPAWIDGEFACPPCPEKDGRGWTDALLGDVARRLGTLLPPGGRLWIAYEAFDRDDGLARETRDALARRVPLLTTPIGRLLFLADCWTGLRDWDIAEGGREGPRKVQGNKPLDRRHASWCAAALRRELTEFLQRPADDALIGRAQARAKLMLPELGQ